MNDKWQELTRSFADNFGGQAQVRVLTPGRVNLIGEHVDYEGGFVLPAAIDRYIYLLARPAVGNVSVFAADRGELDRFGSEPASVNGWGDYPRGVVAKLREAGHRFGGVEIVFGGDLPAGAGLSSSAAVEVAVAAALRAIYDLPISDRDLALLCQKAENEFVGVNSGIMDQFAVALSRADHALLLDCRTQATRHVPLPLGDDYRLVIVDSGQKRSLLTAPYNQRREELEAAKVVISRNLRPVKQLRDLAVNDLPAIEQIVADGEMTDEQFRRVRHGVSEIARVEVAEQRLAVGDLAAFGRLMNAAHASMSADFAASTPEIDRLVAMVQSTPGVLGARITGAGWGGCTVNLLATTALPAFEQTVARFRKESGLPATAFVCRAVDGVKIV